MNDQRRHRPLQRLPGQHPSNEEVWENEPAGEDSLIEDEVWPPRLPTSTRRYQDPAHAGPPGTALVRTSATVGQRMQGVPARRSALPPQRSEVGHAWPPPAPVEREPSPPRQRRERLRLHWSLWLGIGMLIMTLGWLALGVLGNWWQTTQDDWHYGYPRTFQADAVVGHNRDAPAHPSHFLALNLNRHILVIELPAGDPSKAKIYSGPVLLGQGQDRIPVTLSFQDVNGDGKLDLLVWVADTHVVFLNDGNGFRPARPGEALAVSP